MTNSILLEPQISILMPIYNGIEFIQDSVVSIKQQTYINWDLLIGINGHPVNSEVYKIAKQYECENIKVIEILETKGKSNALNEMLKYSKANYIALLDVDDIWLPNKLQSQIQFIQKDFDVVGTMCKYFGDKDCYPSIPLGNISDFNFLIVNPIINSSAIIKKELCYWKDIDLEDYDLWLRLWKQNKTFYNVEECHVLHRCHSNSAFNANGNHLKVDSLLKTFIPENNI
jgi:teichuronic acid biosynthesis glycosyltransferase TuaG